MLKGDMINRGSKDTEKKLTKKQIVYLYRCRYMESRRNADYYGSMGGEKFCLGKGADWIKNMKTAINAV